MRHHQFIVTAISIVISLMMITNAVAQDDTYPIITSENADMIQQVGLMAGDQGRIAVSPDDHWMAVGGLQGVWIFDIDAGDESARLLSGHTDTVNAVAFHPNSNILASGSGDGTVRLWDMTTFEEILSVSISESAVTSVDFDTTGSFLAAAARPSVYIVFAETGTVLQTLDDVQSGIRRVEFLNDSPLLLGTTLQQSLAIWDLNDNVFVGEIDNSFDNDVMSLSTSSDGTQVAVGLLSGRVILNTLATREELLLDYHQAGVRDVQFSPDGMVVASTGMDNQVLLVNPRTGDLITQFQVADFGYSVEFSSDSRLIHVASVDGKINTWDIASRQLVEDRELSYPSVRQVVFSPNGRQIAAVMDEDNLARVFDARTNRQIAVLSGRDERTFTIAYRPNGNLIVTAGSGGDISVWRSDNFKLADTLSTNEDRIYSLAFTPDTNVIAVGGEQFIRLWNLPRKEEILSINHGTTVWSLSVSPDGSLIGASGGLWNAFTREPIGVDIDEFASVAFSPNSDYLATTDGLLPIEPNRIRTPRTGYVGLNNSKVAFSPDGLLVAIAVDTTIEIFAVETQSLITTITGHEGDIRSLAFSPDGTRIVSGSFDATIRQWAVLEDETALSVLPSSSTLQMSRMPSNIPAPVLTSDSITADNADQLSTVVLRQGISNVVDLDVSPNGSQVTLASLQGVFHLELEDLTRAPVALVPQNPAISPSGLAVDYSQDGSLLAVSHGFARIDEAVGGGVTIWDVSGDIPVFVTEFAISGDRGFSVALSNDNSLVAIGFNTPVIRVIQIEEGQQVSQSQSSLVGRINGLTFNPDNSVISASDVAGNKAFFETSTGELITGFNSGVAQPMWWSPNGEFLFSTEQGSIVLRDGFSAEVIAETNFPAEVVGDILDTDEVNGRLVVGADNTIWFLDYETGELSQTIIGFGNRLSKAQVTANGQQLIGVTSDNHLRVWDIQSGIQLVDTALGFTDPQATTAISDDGRFVAIAERDVAVRIFSGETGVLLRKIDTTQTDTLSFLSSSTLLATTGQNGTIETWDAATGRRLDLIEATDNHILIMSDDGNHLVTRNDDKHLSVYNARTGSSIFDRLRPHLARFNDVDIFDGLMATAGDDGVVKLWEIEDAEQIILFYAHQAGVRQIAFAPTETLLATIGEDGINVYDYRPFSSISQRFVFSLTIEKVNGLFFGVDSSLLFVHVDDILHIWSMDNGAKIATYDLPDSPSMLTTDGQVIMITNPDGSIYRVSIADVQSE